MLGYNPPINDLTESNILKYLTTLTLFCKNFLQTDLYNFKIHSLASLSILFLKKHHNLIFQQYPNEVLHFFNLSYFGGRCEVFKPGMFYNVASFDFTAMYGNILTTIFPKKFF